MPGQRDSDFAALRPQPSARFGQGHDRVRALLTGLLEHQDRRFLDVGMRFQAPLHLRQREPLLPDLHNPVGASQQKESAVGVRCDPVAHPIAPAPVGEILADTDKGRGHFETAILLAGRDFHPGEGFPALAVNVTLAHGDAAGLGRAEDLEGRAAQLFDHGLGGLRIEQSAGRENRAAAAAQNAKLFAGRHPLQMYGGGDQGTPRTFRHARQQLPRMQQGFRLKRATAGQGPQHSEEESVDVLVGGRREDARVIRKRSAQTLFESGDLVLQMSPRLPDRAPFSRRAGGLEFRHRCIAIDLQVKIGRSRRDAGRRQGIDHHTTLQRGGDLGRRRGVGENTDGVPAQSAQGLGLAIRGQDRQAAATRQSQQSHRGGIAVLAEKEPATGSEGIDGGTQTRHVSPQVGVPAFAAATESDRRGRGRFREDLTERDRKKGHPGGLTAPGARSRIRRGCERSRR